MEFGFGLPSRGPLATTQNMITLAQRGEEMGFDILMVSDHIVAPRNIESRYPYNQTGEYSSGGTGDYLEQLTTLGFLAGATSKVRLLTSVMVLPHRSSVLTAKMLTTIDVLSQGRLIVGCGVGWMREEFKAIGAPPYEERGAVGDEYIRAFKELWTSDDPFFEGQYCRFSNITFLPKTVQKPHPPIWIGGESPPALRRVARLGDAWFPIGLNPRFPVPTAKRYSEYLERIRRYAEDAGRDPATIDLAYEGSWFNKREPKMLPTGERQPFSGSAEQIAEDIGEFDSLGVRHLLCDFYGTDLNDTLERMEYFATRIKPLA